MNTRFYFRGPTLDVGSTCSFSHTALQRVAASHTESSPKISINFDKFCSVNARFYFQGPALDMRLTYMSNLLAGSYGVVWFLPSMGWFGVVYVNIFNKNSLVWFWFGS